MTEREKQRRLSVVASASPFFVCVCNGSYIFDLYCPGLIWGGGEWGEAVIYRLQCGVKKM